MSGAAPARALAQADDASPIVGELAGFFAGPLETNDDQEAPNEAVEQLWRRTFEAELAVVQIDASRYASADVARVSMAGVMDDLQDSFDLDEFSAHPIEAHVVVADGFADGIPIRLALYIEDDIGFTVMLVSGAVVIDFEDIVSAQLEHSSGERGTLRPNESEIVRGVADGDEARDDGFRAGQLFGQLLVIFAIGSGIVFLRMRGARKAGS